MKNFLSDEDYVVVKGTTAELLRRLNMASNNKHYILADEDVELPALTVSRIINNMEAAGQNAAYSVAVNIAVTGGVSTFRRFEKYYLHNLTREIKCKSIPNDVPENAAYLVVDALTMERLSNIIADKFTMSDTVTVGKICRAAADNGVVLTCYMDCRAARILEDGEFEPKKIDIMVPELSGKGGTEKVVATITSYLKSCGYTIRFILFSMDEPKEWLLDMGDAVSIHCDLEDITAGSCNYAELLRRTYIPDMIMCTFSPVTIAAAYVMNQAYNTHIPIVWWMHNSFRKVTQESVRYLFTLADAYLAISYDIMTEMETFLPRNKIYLVNNPLDKIDRDSRILRDEVLRIAFVGRLVEQKRVDILLNALVHVGGQWQLDVYGNGKLESTLQEGAKTLGISDRIIWHGYVEDPWNQIDKCSILVMPSDYEGFCLSAVEALSMGIPVAITDSTGPCDYIIEKYNGFIIPFDDIGYLAGLLNSIQDGKIQLPDPDNCISSVVQYNKEFVCSNFMITINEIMALR